MSDLAELRGLLGDSLRLHHAVKQAFDPLGILNPGKVLRLAAEHRA